MALDDPAMFPGAFMDPTAIRVGRQDARDKVRELAARIDTTAKLIEDAIAPLLEPSDVEPVRLRELSAGN